jgi:uncharacterized paraquat-inducible protein A
LLIPSNVFPLIRVELFGMSSANLILIGIGKLWGNQWVLFAVVSAALVIAIPFIRFGLLSAVLGVLRFSDRRPGWLGPAFRWAIWLDPWAMTVMLMSIFTMVASMTFDPRLMWDAAEAAPAAAPDAGGATQEAPA